MLDIAARLLILKLLTTRLTRDGYGEYNLVTATAALGTIIFGCEAYRYLQRHVVSVKHPSAWLSAQLTFESILLLGVATSAALIPARLVPSSLVWLAGANALLVGTIVWTELMIVEMVRYVVLQRRGVIGEGAKFARSVAQIALLLALPHPTIRDAMVVLAGSNVVAVAVLMQAAFGRQQWRSGLAHGRTHVLQMLRYARHFFLPALANQLLRVGDRFFVYGILSAADLASYSIAYNIQLLCYGAAGGLASSLVYPLIIRDVRTDGPPPWWRWLRVQLVIQVAASAVLFLMARPIIYLVSSSQYSDAIATTRSLSVLPPLMVLSGGLLMRFVAAGQVRRFAVITVCSALVSVSLYALLIPSRGVAGAVYATLCGYAFSALASSIVIRLTPPGGAAPLDDAVRV